MKTLTLFYDHNCGLCRRCRQWLNRQPTYFPVEFVPYDSLAARALCPDIGKLRPDREIIAMSDDGSIYRGGKAWVMALYATREYRPLAMKLATPLLMPVAKKACALVAENRMRLSKLLRLKSDRDLGDEIAAEPEPNCEGGTCHADADYAPRRAEH